MKPLHQNFSFSCDCMAKNDWNWPAIKIHAHLMHCACCYVLATKNCKCHKTLWKNRQYIIKKALHAGHVWYNYFLFCFVFCFFFCLENGLLDKIWHDIIIIFFVTHHLKTKKCNLDLPLTFTSAREINNAFFFCFVLILRSCKMSLLLF